MELISASEIVRAQGRLEASRPYVEGIEQILDITASGVGSFSPVGGAVAEPRRVLVIAIVSDRGLCGAYNSNVLRAAEQLMRAEETEGRACTLVVVGRRAQRFFRFHGREIASSFVRMTERPTFEDSRRVAREVVGPFLAGTFDLVELVSTRFRSAGIQVVEVCQVLPLVSRRDGKEKLAPSTSAAGFYDFEPREDEVLVSLVPLHTETVLFQALLEASASEHTARQRAMSAATENADELATTLRRLMNRVRQDSITNEIMEVVGGAEAMRLAGRGGDFELLTASPSEE